MNRGEKSVLRRFAGWPGRLAAGLLLLVAIAGHAQDRPPAETPASGEFLATLSAAERAWLREHPVITVALDPGWPPIEFTDARGVPSGMTTDYLRIIEARLGVRFERVTNLSWQEAYTRMQRWEIDLATSVAVTAEREKFWAFTKPYMTIPIVVVTRSDVTYIADLRELAGRKVAVVEGNAPGVWIARDFPDVRLVPVKTTQESLALLQRGEVFACVDNMLVVGSYLAGQKMTDLKVAGTTPYTNAQCMAVRKDWAPLAAILDKVLDSVSPAEREAIYRRWLPLRYEAGVDYTRLWPVAALFAAALLGLVAWNWKLAGEIRNRKRAEEELGHSQALLCSVSEGASDAIYVKDRQGRYLMINSAALRMFGRSREAVLGRDDTALLPPEEADRVMASDLQVMASASAQTCEESVTNGGGPRIFLTEKGPLRDAQGKVTGMFGIARDITAWKQTEASLRRTDRALRMVAACNRQLVGSGSETELLHAICRIIVEQGGYRMAWIGFAEANEAKSVRPVAQAGFEAGYLETVDISWADTERGRGPSGTSIRTGRPVIVRDIHAEPAFAPWRVEAIRRGYASLAALPLLGDGRAFGTLVVYAAERDAVSDEDLVLLADFASHLAYGLTALRVRAEREKAEAALHETHTRLTAVMENLSEGLIMGDEQGRILYWNPAALALNGFANMDDCRRHLAEFARTFEMRLPDEDRPLPVADWPMNRVLRGERLHDCVFRLRRLDQGWEKIIAYSGWLIRHAGGEKFVFLSATDITERRQAEEKLRASEQGFRTMAEAMPQIVWVTLADGGNIYFNRRWEDYTGLTAEESSGANWTRPFHPEDRQRAWDAWQNAILHHDIYSVECRLRRADGTYRWWLIRGSPLRDAEGKIFKWFGTCTDIEDLKRGEQALRASEIRYRRLFESAKDGILILNAETGMIVDVNPFFIEIMGYSQEALLGKKVWELGFLKNIVANEAHFTELQAKEYVRYDDMALETSDGRRVEVEFVSNVYLVGGQKVIQCNIRDITARVQAEKKMQQTVAELEQARQVLLSVVEDQKESADQLRKLSAIIEQAPLSVVITDLDGAIEYVNPRFSLVTGYTAAEALGQNPRILQSGETPPEVYHAMWETLRRGEVWTGELTNRTKSGERYRESVVIAPVVDGQGRATHYVALKDDITAKQRHEAELVAKLAREQELSEMKTRFISVTSHEFRTPMAAAMGSAELLANHLDRLSPEKRQELLARITASLHRMTEMLDEVLLLNRMDANRVEVRLAPLDLRSFVHQAIEEIRLGDRDRHRFEFHATGDARDFPSDTNLLHHIVSNLLSNAVRFSPAGTLITVQLAADAGQARVTVEDRGIGIPPADHERIFEPFERGSNVGTIKGTGLGLNIVKRMTGLLGGTVTLAAVESGGSRFTITLPRLARPAPALDDK